MKLKINIIYEITCDMLSKSYMGIITEYMRNINNNEITTVKQHISKHRHNINRKHIII